MTSNNPTQIIAKPGEREVIITRVFDAPRDVVFRACTDPKLIPQWWGPARYTTKVDKMDVRPSGTWRFIQTDSEGNEFGFNGTYGEIVPPERYSYTFEFEPMPGHILHDTVTFEDEGGKTKMTIHSVFQSVEDRDGMLNSGMESGLTESHDRFEQVLRREEERILS